MLRSCHNNNKWEMGETTERTGTDTENYGVGDCSGENGECREGGVTRRTLAHACVQASPPPTTSAPTPRPPPPYFLRLWRSAPCRRHATWLVNSGRCVRALPNPEIRRRGTAVLRGAAVRGGGSAGLAGPSRAAAGAVAVYRPHGLHISGGRV